MKNLTKSDLINIEAFKGLLNMLANDIKQAKGDKPPPEVKARLVFKLSIQRSQLMNNAASNYPQINWIDFATGPDNTHDKDIIIELKAKTLNRLGLN